VATEIDLPWTYVGGPAGLIDRILADEGIEALPADPADSVTHLEEWVTDAADQAAAALLSRGEALREEISSYLARSVVSLVG
jgi:hypothetical protein